MNHSNAAILILKKNRLSRVFYKKQQKKFFFYVKFELFHNLNGNYGKILYSKKSKVFFLFGFKSQINIFYYSQKNMLIAYWVGVRVLLVYAKILTQMDMNVCQTKPKPILFVCIFTINSVFWNWVSVISTQLWVICAHF